MQVSHGSIIKSMESHTTHRFLYSTKIRKQCCKDRFHGMYTSMLFLVGVGILTKRLSTLWATNHIFGLCPMRHINHWYLCTKLTNFLIDLHAQCA